MFYGFWIGKFIAEMRKEQNLTQQDLAEKLGISNKTISKWECGNGMPDYAVMESLCRVLNINVNELLSGERLPSQEYGKKAEENMISLIQESSVNHKRDMREWLGFIIGVGAVAFVMWLTIIMWGGIEAMGAVIIWGRLDDITILGPNLAVSLLTFVYGLVATLLLIPIEQNRCAMACQGCGAVFLFFKNRQ